jgi:hypothetical protein
MQVAQKARHHDVVSEATRDAYRDLGAALIGAIDRWARQNGGAKMRKQQGRLFPKISKTIRRNGAKTARLLIELVSGAEKPSRPIPYPSSRSHGDILAGSVQQGSVKKNSPETREQPLAAPVYRGALGTGREMIA